MPGATGKPHLGLPSGRRRPSPRDGDVSLSDVHGPVGHAHAVHTTHTHTLPRPNRYLCPPTHLTKYVRQGSCRHIPPCSCLSHATIAPGPCPVLSLRTLLLPLPTALVLPEAPQRHPHIAVLLSCNCVPGAPDSWNVRSPWLGADGTLDGPSSAPICRRRGAARLP